ncbi:hypothetical protein PsorP6_014158 [Peronosclerospora sorghi]|uniref:Uncharacterized protein n=1 Tax=Peronosclerospora sorghi TaxID=230839 RepID=A0ACC0VHI4_9STRA|nr:hypothetical protein PsorP6_014158 [Peronosclerospora sorghi]
MFRGHDHLLLNESVEDSLKRRNCERKMLQLSTHATVGVFPDNSTQDLNAREDSPFLLVIVSNISVMSLRNVPSNPVVNSALHTEGNFLENAIQRFVTVRMGVYYHRYHQNHSMIGLVVVIMRRDIGANYQVHLVNHDRVEKTDTSRKARLDSICASYSGDKRS